jgi:hypothetical protein
MVSRLTLVLVVALAVVAGTPGRVAACSCAGTSEQSALRDADVAFEGVAAEVEDPNLVSFVTRSGGDPLVYTFAVETVLKGEPARFVEIRTYRDEAACGLSMAIGDRWRIYAHRQDLFGDQRGDELWVWLCDANAQLARGVPVPAVPGNSNSVLVLGIAIAGLLGAGALWIRRRGAGSQAAD